MFLLPLALLGCPWIPTPLDTAACTETVYADTDGDGFGDPDAVGASGTCAGPGWVTDNDDCDDGDATVTETIWYNDADGDTFGDVDGSVKACTNPGGYVLDATDCDDHDIAINPSADEVCDPDDTDEDCNTLADDADPDVDPSGFSSFYADSDGDTFGAADSVVLACDAPENAVSDDTDCDDTSNVAYPGGVEICDDLDNDCDGTTDLNAIDEPDWHADADGDTYGDPDNTAPGCTAPEGYVGDATDCNDSDSAYNPGAAESDCADPNDYNCDGSVGYEDSDADSWAACEDCDDDDADGAIHPDAVEICEDGIDDDCDDSDAVCSTFGDYTTAWGSEMIAIPAGTFTMGGGAADTENSYADHEVTLTHDFWIGETEITRGEWEAWSGGSGWAFTTSYPCTTSTTEADCPADSICWYDVAMYANALSVAEGLAECYLADGTDLAAAYLTDPYACPGYRLPTEAEWEYAARADGPYRYAGSDTLDDVAWNSYNAYSLGTYSHEVATLAPNAWGLYDMSGNLWELTNDWYDPSHGGFADGSADVDPAGPATGSEEGYEGSGRVFRGGSWGRDGSYERVAFRYTENPAYRLNSFGARLSRSMLDP